MPHCDWRPRLSIDLPPEAAQALRERLPYGAKSQRLRALIERLCLASAGARVCLIVRIGRDGQVESWEIDEERSARPLARQAPAGGRPIMSSRRAG